MLDVAFSIPSTRVIRALDRLVSIYGRPAALRMDNGPELISEALAAWCEERKITMHHIQPGKPDQNAYIERFNRTLRNELLDQHLFVRLEDVREAAYWWMLEYNEERPHSSLGYLALASYAQTFQEATMPEGPLHL